MQGLRLYRGGWVATTDTWDLEGGPEDLAAVLPGWTSHAVGPLEVRHDDAIAATRARAGESEILLLGIAMDVTRPELGQDSVVAELARELETSWGHFLDRIDRLGGAHVIFASARGRTRLLQDATGMEAACYDVSGGSQLISSHPGLIADLGGYEPAQWGLDWLKHPQIAAGGIYFPGLRTLYDEVRILTPNTWLDAGTRAIERFFPREPLQELSVEEIVERTAPLLEAQCRWMSERHPCIISLSGGLDSRLTLAASRQAADRMRYFTYVGYGNKVHRNDAEVAGELAERLGLSHEVWRIARNDPVDPEWLAMGDRVHRGAQGDGKFNGGLAAHFPDGHVQIRSNVLETMRGFYLKNSVNRPDRFTSHKLSRLFRMATAEEFAPHFEEFCAVTGFDQRAKLNYHYSDLFYWEHRMGSWHGAMLRGLKASHQTYVIYNCRLVLTQMLSRPMPDRISGIVVYRLIDRLWPEVLDTPIYSGAGFAKNPLLEPPPAPAADAEPAAAKAAAPADPAPGAPSGPPVPEPVMRYAPRTGLRLPGRKWTAGQLAREAIRRATGKGAP